MNAIEHTYRSLLADVADLTRDSKIRGSCSEAAWCINDAPKLEKALLQSIELGESLDLSTFPKELRDLAVGSLTDPIKLRYLRQLLLFSYKAYVPSTNNQVSEAYKAFETTNIAVQQTGEFLSKGSPILLDIARRHCQSVLYKAHWKDINPSHGPGASTSPKEIWTRWYSTLDSVYPYSDYMFMANNRDHCSELDTESLTDIIEANVAAVPKDSRGPRIICVHPAEAIWIQQGVRRELERCIQRSRHCYGPWPRGRIHFNDQSVNGKIALISSKNRKYATIDMKEASDRIPDVLVQILFGNHYKYFGCSRAQRYRIKDDTIKYYSSGDIHSYAPMGNATTFPVESLVFWAICVASMQFHGFHQPGAAFVFGDDIIIPTEAAPFVIDDLESFGLLVNRGKSFYRGPFRESCGVDAFNGIDVTPVRWKTSIDADHLSGLVALSDIAMRLRIARYPEASRAAYECLRYKLKSNHGRDLFLTNNRFHGGIAEYTEITSLVWRDAYWHRDLQMFVSPVAQVKGDPSVRVMQNWNSVLESVCSLERTGAASVPDRTVSDRLRLKSGWTRVE